MPKIGIIGGTFDPIHNGHTEMAKKALERLKLSKVLFMTGGNPPHKKEFNITDAAIRHEMVKEAIKGIKNLKHLIMNYKNKGIHILPKHLNI